MSALKLSSRNEPLRLHLPPTVFARLMRSIIPARKVFGLRESLHTNNRPAELHVGTYLKLAAGGSATSLRYSA